MTGFYLEQKIYTNTDLSLSEKDITSLTLKGVLVPLNEINLKFNFVGVISVSNNVFVVLPKTWAGENSEDCLTKIPLTIKTLQQYRLQNTKKFEGIDFFQNDPGDPGCSEIAVAEFLLDDYRNHGIYRFSENRTSLNGEGHINWPLTVMEVNPVFSHGCPVYIDTINDWRLEDEFNLTALIHAWAIELVSEKFSDLLGEEHFNPSLAEFKDLLEINSRDTLIVHLEKEIRAVYTDREIHLLKSLLFLLKLHAPDSVNSLTLFGTLNYQNVWEAICKTVTKNNFKLDNIFPNPIWKILGESFSASGTLIPDIVTKDSIKNEIYLFDAKYYSLSIEAKNLSGQPGYKDILKQFQYQFHIEQKIGKSISNAFLFPYDDKKLLELESDKVISTNDNMTVVGHIQYSLFNNKKIWVILCPLEKWQNLYISNLSLEFNNMYWSA